MKFLRIIRPIILIPFLTIFTQIGGLLYLVCIFFRKAFKKRFPERRKRILAKLGNFSIIYLLITFLLVPPIAKRLGRVPLPLTGNLKPLNYLTAVFSRHYVRPELLNLLKDTADQLDKKYPGTIVAYMDANFPFLNGFPLLPHLSHSDGKKADIAFLYKDPETGEAFHRVARNFMGYGGMDGPRKGETNMSEICDKKGKWQYSIMSTFMPSRSQDDMLLDHVRMKAFVRILVNDRRTGKILIEPHLKERLGLNYNKVRFHGCHAVRHDDHLHVQL